LLLREDNADLRLRDLGYALGLVSREEYDGFLKKKKAIYQTRELLKEFKLRPEPWVQETLRGLGSKAIGNVVSLEELLRRNELSFYDLTKFCNEISRVPKDVAEEVEIMVKYEGYIERQLRQVERLKKLEAQFLPPEIDYYKVHGLSNEVKEKLSKVRPRSLGQASRIPGVTPAAIMALSVHLKTWQGFRPAET